MSTRIGTTQDAAVNSLMIWLRMLPVAFGTLLAARLLLLVSYPSYFEGLDRGEIISAFFVGLRFDVATMFLVVSLPLFLLWIPWPKAIDRTAMTVSRWASFLFIITAVSFLWSDLLFWGESGRHLTVEPAGIGADILPMLALVIRQYPLPLLGLFITFLILFYLVRWAFRPACSGCTLRSWWKTGGIFLLVAAVSFLGIRGSLGKEPLRSSDALLAGSDIAGGLALNGVYSVISSVFNKQKPPVQYMAEEEAEAITRSLVACEGDVFKSAEYPLLRKSAADSFAGSTQRLNVVLIVVESLNASYLKSFGGDVSVMPFLDSLAEQSLIFTDFSAFGTRSFRGLCAIVASLPNLDPNPYALTLLLPRLRGLGDIFREKNYRVRFMHAAAPGSMGIQGVCSMAGYDDFVTADDFPESEHNGSWGVWDHAALERMSGDMDAMPEPYHYGLFTLCTHAPWTLPDGYTPRFARSQPDAERLNTFAYLDEALKTFFARETKSGRAARTLYVIVGDHTSHALEDETFRVACIFFAPGRLTTEKRDVPMGQLDILPTVLEICGINAEHAAYGRSMFDPDSAARFVVTDQSNTYGWRRGSWQLVCNADKLLALYDLREPFASRRNHLTLEHGLADSLAREFHAFFQTAEHALRENRVSL